jgi:hypothetical protein
VGRYITVPDDLQAPGGIVLINHQPGLKIPFADMDVLLDRVPAEQLNERRLGARTGHRTDANARDYQVIDGQRITLGAKEADRS